MPENDLNTVEIPFKHRHHCWFCGEPSFNKFEFPPEYSGNLLAFHSRALGCSHPRLKVPSCVECNQFARQADVDSIWAVKEYVKRCLLKRYRKDLAIGVNWTQEELKNSEFEGGCFEVFQKSAWFMYEVAQARVNFIGWPIAFHGVDLVVSFEDNSFEFDGVNYPSLDEAISHYCQLYSLNKLLLMAALDKVGVSRFAHAVRFCRLLLGATPNEQKQSLKEFN